MKKLLVSGAAAGALSAAALASPAFALSSQTFVSASGTNAGACASPATACRTFAFAYAQTTPGGEIRALGPGNYAPVTIDHSIRIAGGEGVGIQIATAGTSIVVNTPPADSVEIVGVSIDGTLGVAGNSGVQLVRAGALTVKNCVIRNLKGFGVRIAPTGASRVLIENTILEGSGSDNIRFDSLAAGSSIKATLDNVTVTRGGGAAGVHILGEGGSVDITNSVVSDNLSDGIAIGGGVVTLSRSVSTRNGARGVFVNAGTARSAGDNFLGGNFSGPVAGALTYVGQH